ncbi:MAG: hypothetical protein H8D67_18890 [Deltaproteobacteria bacterium]|nr:hypothetical protein [Deltaproteobacteria bacterium]
MKILMKGYNPVWVCAVLFSIFLTVLPVSHWDRIVKPYFNQLQFIGISLYLVGGFVFNWTERGGVLDRWCFTLCLLGCLTFFAASGILYFSLAI